MKMKSASGVLILSLVAAALTVELTVAKSMPSCDRDFEPMSEDIECIDVTVDVNKEYKLSLPDVDGFELHGWYVKDIEDDVPVMGEADNQLAARAVLWGDTISKLGVEVGQPFVFYKGEMISRKDKSIIRPLREGVVYVTYAYCYMFAKKSCVKYKVVRVSTN